MANKKYTFLMIILLGALIALVLAVLLFFFRDQFKSPERLYLESQEANPQRAHQLFIKLAEKLPELSTYSQLWATKRSLPEPLAVEELHSITALSPQSLEAYFTYLEIARLNVVLNPPLAESAYRRAIQLNNNIPLRLEMAGFLEERGEFIKANLEYRSLLREVPDAFQGVRRTGEDPIKLAGDLNDATYFSDALDTIHNSHHPDAIPLKARAYYGLGKFEEAEEAFLEWLEEDPVENSALMGMANTYVQLGKTQEAREIYEQIGTSDSLLELARLLEMDDPDRAIALYIESPYPVAWWNATWLLEEQGRQKESIPLYHDIANAGTYFSDDAAYRLFVLGNKFDDKQAMNDAITILNSLEPNWLNSRTSEESLEIVSTNYFNQFSDEIFRKVQALETVGRDDLAEAELLFTSRRSQDPWIKSKFLNRLSASGNIIDSQAIAENYITSNPESPLEFWRLSYPKPYRELVESVAGEFGVDPDLIWAIMRVESRFNHDALSLVGARGLMQIMPSTQDWIAEQMEIKLEPGDAYRPEVNVRLGGWYLNYLIDYFDGDIELAILAYNGGFLNVEEWQSNSMVANREDLLRWIGFGETREYLQRVMLDYLVYQTIYREE